MSEQIKIGTKVRTAAALTATVDGKPWGGKPWAFHAVVVARRRPGVDGVVFGFTGDHEAPFMVRHEDGSTAPYARSELAPIPDEKAAPTTPIGRLRAACSRVLGGLLHEGEWRAVDAAIDEVEGEIASLRAVGAGALPWVGHGPREMDPGDAVRMNVAREALRAAVGTVGPMPVEKAADGVPWSDDPICEGCEQPAADGHRCAAEPVRDPDGHEVGPAAWELEAASVFGERKPANAADPLVALHAERRDLEKARRTRTLYLPEATRLEALTAEIDRLEVEEARQRGEAWTRPEPVKAARPRVGGWVGGFDVTGALASEIRDDRGQLAACAWPLGSDQGFGWTAARPFRSTAKGQAGTLEAAKAAAVAVLATWADVEGQPEATVETWPCDLCGQPMVSEPAKAPAPPLSLVVAFGSEGAPVILEAAGPWEGIEERPSPPARGLWRWVGKATRHDAGDVGGWLFEGTWTALPVPA